MRHKKIPTKNRKKLKSVDPFNNRANAARAVKKVAQKKLNWVPKSAEADQPMTSKQRELQEAMQPDGVAVMPKKSRGQKKSKVLMEAEKMGMYKRRFEGMQQFVKRVERSAYMAIHEHKILLEQGKAGRQQSEIDAEFKEIDDKEKRSKEQKKREVQKAIEKARKERAAVAKATEEREEAKRQKKEDRRRQRDGDFEEEEQDVEEGDDQEEDEGSEQEEEQQPKKKKAKIVKKKVFGVSKKPPVSEAIINRKEIVRFGERYDEPPKFGGALKDKLDPLTAKAGGKNLLLHSLLKKSSEEGATYLERADKKRTAAEEDRQKVIDAYRDMKRKRRDAAASI